MLGKYCKHRHPLHAKVLSTHSRVWKNLCRFRMEAESHIHWILGQGDCDFFLDDWLPSGPLVPLESMDRELYEGLKVRDVLDNGMWDDQLISELAPHDRLEEIRLTVPLVDSRDILVWKNTRDGRFSFRHTYEDIRASRPVSAMYREIWHSFIPTKMSFLAWKLGHRFVTTDDVLQRRGVPMASKCQCCSGTESMEHVFFNGPFASAIWSHYAEVFGIVSPIFSCLHNVLTTWSFSKPHPGHIRQVLPIVVLWVLWEARNKSKHEGITLRFYNTCHRIDSLILYIGHANLFLSKYWTGDSEAAGYFGIHIRPSPRPRLMLLKWNLPPIGSLKLNVDGGFKDGRGGGGGLIRDHKGDILFGLGFTFNSSSALEAEMEALSLCLEWVYTNNLLSVQVEIDSKILVDMLANGGGDWRLLRKLHRLRFLLHRGSYTVSHIYREANMAADHLVKVALRADMSFTWRPDQIDRHLRAILRLEKEGVPYPRRTPGSL